LEFLEPISQFFYFSVAFEYDKAIIAVDSVVVGVGEVFFGYFEEVGGDSRSVRKAGS